MSSKSPLVTVMIPTYNHEKYIKQTIESVLNQTYENMEIIVSDDCSTDSTFEKAAEISDPRLSVHQNKNNLGRLKNYRKLLYHHARGKWVLMLDGDDYFTWDDYLKHCINNYCSKLALNLVFARIYRNLPDDYYEEYYDYPRIFNQIRPNKKLLFDDFIVTQL